ATMLPLDRIRPRNKLEGRILNYPGVKGEAINLVSHDGQYSRLFSHLLNGTLVVDTMDHALAISKDHKVRIVTLEGDLISPEGAMSGGGKSKDSGIISRKVEIEELEMVLGNNEREQKIYMEKHESLLNREEKSQKQLSLVESRLQQSEEKVKMAEQKHAVAEREVMRMKQEKIINAREKDNLIIQVQEAQNDLQTKKDEIDQLQNEPQKGISDEDKAKFKELEETLNRSGAILQERELKRVSLLERSQSAAREKEYLLEKVSELKQRLERRHEIILQKNKERDEISVGLESVSKRFDELQNEKNSQQAVYFKMKEDRDGVRNRRKELQKSALDIADQLRKSDHALTDIAVKEEGLRVKQEELFNRIHAEFHVNIEDIYFSRRENEDELFLRDDDFPKLVEEANQRISELDAKLGNLGNVNFEAVEELKSLEERESDLKGQMGDLTSSFSKLDTFIKDLDRQCNEMFKETFDKVNEHFIIMFRRLFGGGQGRLEIEKDVNPLDAGITISASPPGKSPKVLSQLSGGEKVLTTIAFLFSIFLYKPSPFCILDEIDAPLDEHNVDRFMEAIRSFTDRCQFLVVTHNRRTMSLSDVIHGVTMQDTGISNCMSVDMTTLEYEDGSAIH
ncbi:MAG: AAA family ATPase, partial [Planctomycetes bacterium]|nr:AAA family ATPase [Planctomycetota bacterium]